MRKVLRGIVAVLVGLQAAWMLTFVAAVVVAAGLFYVAGYRPENSSPDGDPSGLLFGFGFAAAGVLLALTSYGLSTAERLVRAPWRQLVLAGGAVEVIIGTVSIAFTTSWREDFELGLTPWLLMNGFAAILGLGAIVVVQSEYRSPSSDHGHQPDVDLNARN